MGVFASFTKNRKTILVCILSLNALVFCVWIFVQDQTPRRKVVTYDQQTDELFPNSSLFKLKKVTESDVRLWQGKFYSSLASAKKQPQSKLGSTKMKALTLYTYNQSHLRDINQFTLPDNEPRQSVKTTSQNGLLQFLEIASCKPLTPDVVLYNRVYKTGSETTGALFQFVAAMMNYLYTKRKYGLRKFLGRGAVLKLG